MSVVQIDNMQVMSIGMWLMSEHPSIVSLGMQLKKIYQDHADEVMRISLEYQQTASKITDDPMGLQQIAVILEEMKAHQNAAPVVVQVLALIAPHMAELSKTITQLQSKL